MNAPDRCPSQEFGAVAAELLDWLAGFLSAPMSVATATACRSHEGNVLFHAIDEESGAMPGLAAMRCVFAGDDSDARLAARLSGRYVRLFEGPGGPATVYLSKSADAGPARRLQQQATADMESLLRRCDLAVRRGYREPADHLALELALLAALLRVGDQDAAQHLCRRLASWVPRAIAACSACDPGGFHLGASTAVQDTLMAFDATSSTRIPHVRSN